MHYKQAESFIENSDLLDLNERDKNYLSHLNFELYLIEKTSNLNNQKTLPSRRLIKSFRTLSASKHFKSDRFYKRELPGNNFIINPEEPFELTDYDDENDSELLRVKKNYPEFELATFQYELTGLLPETKYSFELSARLSHVESFSSQPVRITTGLYLKF